MSSYLLAKEAGGTIKLPCHVLQSGPTEACCLQTAATDQLGMNMGLRQGGVETLFLKTSFWTLLLGLSPSQGGFFGWLHAVS